jgi:hypothetical protein
MRSAALLFALFSVVVGVIGLVVPDSLMAMMRQSMITPAGLYAFLALRVAVGLLMILVAPTSRAPKTLRAFGAVVALQGLALPFVGIERTQLVLEWETSLGTAVLRGGAVLALAVGSFIAFAVTPVRRPTGGAK